MAIHALDLFEAGLDGRARRDLASGELPGQFGNRQLINHAVHRGFRSAEFIPRHGSHWPTRQQVGPDQTRPKSSGLKSGPCLDKTLPKSALLRFRLRQALRPIADTLYRPSGTVGERPPKGKVKTSPLRANKRAATIVHYICLPCCRRSWRRLVVCCIAGL